MTADPPPARSTDWRFLVILIGLTSLPELALLGADLRVWGNAGWRPYSYQNGAFWAGLLHGWRPNYAAQPVTMFLSYGFLHTGPVHLITNMATLAFLGPPILIRLGRLRFLLLYLGAMVAGAVAFGLLAQGVRPMVGASGALFGLVGAWITWSIRDSLRAGLPGQALLRHFLWPVTALTFLNLAMLWIAKGELAWETHLGGFIAGAGLAVLLSERPTTR